MTVFYKLETVVRTHASGPPDVPLRIKLPSGLFAEFQADFRQLAAEVGIEAIYPGSVLGVPVVESAGDLPLITAADGSEFQLQMNSVADDVTHRMLCFPIR